MQAEPTDQPTFADRTSREQDAGVLQQQATRSQVGQRPAPRHPSLHDPLSIELEPVLEMPEIASVTTPLAPHASSGTQNGSGRPANVVVTVPLVAVIRYCMDTLSTSPLCGFGGGNEPLLLELLVP